MNDYITLQSVTPNDGGIFTALNSFSVPWKNTISPELIDLQYYGNVSGEKIISPLVYKQLNSEGKLTVAKQGLIASMIFSMFGTNWSKEWETLSMQYDPIANYDMTEVMKDDETVTDYGKTNTRTNNLTHAKTGTETDAPSVSINTSDTVHGFNSLEAVPTDGRSQSTSGSDVTTFDTSDTDTGTVTDVGSGSDTSTRNYELTRKGNIGVTSSQQLLQSERDLWVWNYFLDVVFPDVDKILTIPIYAEETSFTGSAAEPTGTINIVENGLHIDVKQFAFADVMVPNSYTEEDQGKVVSGDDLVSQTSREIMENDTYDTTTNNSVTVNVPNSYTAADEGKVVSDGSLVSQTSRTVTENDTYDTTTNNSVTVNVPAGANYLFGTDDPVNGHGNDGDIYLKTVSDMDADLPSGYTEIPAIEGTGTQYIDTNISTAQNGLKVKANVNITGVGSTSPSSGDGVWGGVWALNGFFLTRFGDTPGVLRWHSGGASCEKTINLNEWMSVVTSQNGMIIDDNTYPLTYGSNTPGTLSLLFVGSHLTGVPAKAKLARTKVSVDNTLVGDFVPCIYNNVVGMYDLINEVFHPSESGSFNAVTVNSVVDVYIKVSGTWEPIIGSNVNDII